MATLVQRQENPTDRYEKIRVIGQGAFGKVYLCRRVIDGSPLVIKQIPVEDLQPVDRVAATTEITVLAMLKHPNIIAYYANYVEEKSLMIVMEYAPGGTLCEYIQERNDALMEEDHVLHFFVQLLVAIEHVHSLNILHRDLKTQNVMMNRKRNVLKIGDFGISKVLSSKITSAQTVVGTPCYISPEICEGKLYAKKSDIWALGCILYELITLKKAFDGPNLPALVMNIMKAAATLKPMDVHFSQGLQDLVHSLLQKSPDDRPGIHNVMATPVVINALMNLSTDIGRVPCTKAAANSSSVDGAGGKTTPVLTRMGLGGKIRKGSAFKDDSTSLGQERVKLVPHPIVLLWGGNTALPMELQPPPEADSKVVGVACGRSQRAGITEDGKLIFWKVSTGSLATTRMTMLQGALGRESLSFAPQLIGGLESLVIKKVACGDTFTACLTNKGILMTFGSGTHGCLGHGSTEDFEKPKLVQSILEFGVTDIACGSSHVVAVTADGEVFTWGKGDKGQLGHGTRDPHNTPRMVALPLGSIPVSVCCGTDCSILVTASGEVLAAGNNLYNKLALNKLMPDKAEGDGDSSNSSTSGEEGSGKTPDDKQEEGAPAILGLMKGLPPGRMGSSIIMSSFHSRLVQGKVKEQPPPSRPKGAVNISMVFERVVALKSWKIAAATTGINHTTFLTVEGDCVTCGDNVSGQLGHVMSGDLRPAIVGALVGKGVEKVACGDFFTVACTKKGEVYTWGRGRRGRLGRETEEDVLEPQPVPFEYSQTVQSLACSHGVTLLLITPQP